MSDPQPEFSPSYLVAIVVREMGELGVEVQMDGHKAYAAGLAAGDLLRALGIAPANAPRLPRGGAR